MEFQHPLPLKPGDKVAILSPSSGLPFVFPWVYEQGLQRIKEVFLLEPVEFPTARQSPEFLSNNPQARADDINNAFADPSIKGIIATIGGTDQIKILPYLDKKVIASHPKIFMGFSDCTNLHLFLWNLGLISYYGGSVMNQFAMGGGMHRETIHSINKALFAPPIGPIHSFAEYSDADLDWSDKQNLSKKRPMYPGKGWHWHNCHGQVVSGRLWGGCLESIASHLHIKTYLPSLKSLADTILFIETAEDMPSSDFVEQFIASLNECGMLSRFKAILVGIPKAQFCGKQPKEGREAYIESQKNAITKALKDHNSHIPVIFNMNFGHTDPQIILPNGGLVKINCAEKQIEILC
jgi:muramoyltetrapeptide carboxypeptidase LdcA involved in peptidoglycan recycling